MPRTAEIYTAHDYVQGTPTCSCADAADHAPCAECGSAKDSFIHTEEGRVSGAMLTVIAADTGSGAESTG